MSNSTNPEPEHSTKQGRPRRYPSTPLEGFADPAVGSFAAGIDELHERTYDLIVDLPVSAINFVAPNSALSIGWLATHMIVAEASLIGRIAGQPIPDAVTAEPNYATFTPYGTELKHFGSGESIVSLGKMVLAEYTLPALRGVSSIETETGFEALPTISETLRHLSWHWVYHSGQIGLIRLQWGSDYEWRF